MSGVHLPPARREAVVEVSPAFLLEACKVGRDARAFRCIESPLPVDVQFVRAGHDPYGNLNLVVSSASFPAVRDGETLIKLPSPCFRAIGGRELAREAREWALFDDDKYEGGVSRRADLLRRLADYLDPPVTS